MVILSTIYDDRYIQSRLRIIATLDWVIISSSDILFVLHIDVICVIHSVLSPTNTHTHKYVYIHIFIQWYSLNFCKYIYAHFSKFNAMKLAYIVWNKKRCLSTVSQVLV